MSHGLATEPPDEICPICKGTFVELIFDDFDLMPGQGMTIRAPCYHCTTCGQNYLTTPQINYVLHTIYIKTGIRIPFPPDSLNIENSD